jgi:pimeloyl-ACP methyl ester carboxylesterase
VPAKVGRAAAALLLTAVPWCVAAQRGSSTAATAREALAELPGVRLWFSDSGGAGEPVVFLHANTGTSETWAPQVAAFTRAGYRAIAFDRRGWGKSTANPLSGPQPGTVADDLEALASFLGLGKFHLVGVAGGGFVALDYAAWRGDHLLSLVIGASTGAVTDRPVQEVIERIEIPGIRAQPAHYREVGPSYRATNPEGTARWIAIHDRAQQPGVKGQPLRSPNTFAKLETVGVRTLVLAADADLLAPPGLMWIWAQHVKGARWGVVPGAGHAVAWERPEAFDQLVLPFLRGRSRLPLVRDVPRP